MARRTRSRDSRCWRLDRRSPLFHSLRCYCPARPTRSAARQLGVSHNTLYDHGAVSEETACEMARGVRRALGSDVGVSVTGIAGPGGGLPGKPVGLTWIALSARDFDRAEHYVWDGDRISNKEKSAEAALVMLKEYLESL